MDWDLKVPSWELPEVDQDAAAAAAATGPAAGLDLKLGGLGESRAGSAGGGAGGGGAGRRARAAGSGGQIAACLVDGCKSDLSKCRDYHRRHKVCEVHSKTQIVMVGGQEQRFCQQCSRFHLLVEFDEVKRSCRKRLDGHNRRRRKPQPDPLSSASLYTNHQGARFTAYPPIFPTATTVPNWPGIIKTEDDMLYLNQQHLSFGSRQQNVPSSFSISFKDAKKFPFLQEGDIAIGTRTPLLKTIPAPEAGSTTKTFPDGIANVLGSDCALSLLSSPMRSAAMNLGQMVSTDRIPLSQPLVSSLPYSNLGQYSGSQASSSVSPTGFSFSGIEDDHGTILVSDAGDAELQCHGIFHVGGEGSSDGTSQALPFWL